MELSDKNKKLIKYTPEKEKYKQNYLDNKTTMKKKK